MRILCLFFPRLATDLAGAASAGELVLLDGHGDEAVVTASTAPRVGRGMLAGQAHQRASRARFLPDNAGDCLDELQRLAAIVRKTATPLVAIGGRDHLFVDIAGLYGSEADIAGRLVRTVGEWATTEVRAGVASTRAMALEAARAARSAPAIDTAASEGDEPAITPHDPAAVVAADIPAGPALERRLERALARLVAVLDARGEGFRTLRLTGDDGRVLAREHARNPVHAADEAHALLPVRLEGSASLRIELGGIVPDVCVRPASSPASKTRRPAHVPVRRLRRRALPLAS